MPYLPSPRMLESSATVKRPVIGRDSVDGVTQPSYTTINSNLPCSVQQAGMSIRLLYAQRNQEVSTTIYFIQSPQCQPNDIIVATDRTGTATTYQVVGELQSVGQGRVWNVDCTVIR